jgi:hypothetical protein
LKANSQQSPGSAVKAATTAATVGAAGRGIVTRRRVAPWRATKRGSVLRVRRVAGWGEAMVTPATVTIMRRFATFINYSFQGFATLQNNYGFQAFATITRRYGNQGQTCPLLTLAL